MPSRYLTFRDHLIQLAVLVAAFTITANAQRPMLGEANEKRMQRTKLGIAFFSNGFDRVKPKKIKNTSSWLKRNDMSHLVSEFQRLGWEVDQMSSQLDDGFNEVRNKWLGCGFRQAAGLNPASLTVTVEEKAFYDMAHPGVQIAGLVDKNRIRVVVSHVGRGWLQNYRNLFQWEVGNWFQCKLKGCAQTIPAEIGSNSPCGK